MADLFSELALGGSSGKSYGENIDRAGRVTRTEYDALNRVTKILKPDGSSETITYDAAGRVVAAGDANRNATHQLVDSAGHIIEETDALGYTVKYGYDANGNRVSSTDQRGNVTHYVYDELNRLIKIVFPDATTQVFGYNGDSTKGNETDQNGNVVNYGYDTRGRLNRVTLSVGGSSAVTTYGYDEQGNKVSQTDAEGRTTKWAYDNGGRVTKRTLPNGEAESYTYDALGQTTSHIDFTGKKTVYTYDLAGRINSSLDASGNRIGYTYTPSGQVATVTDSRGKTSYAYDAQDRLIEQDNPDGSYLVYAYDANGNRTQLTTASGTVNYTYDGLNRMTGVTGQDGKQATYQYDANGNRIKTVNPNGTETAYGYDSQNRLTLIEHKTSATGALIRGFAYTLAANGQRTQIKESDASGTLRTTDYVYDSTGRLTQSTLTDAKVSANNKTVTYVYGKTGNRQTKTETQGGKTTVTSYTYDSDDRLITETSTQGTSTATTTYTWDANGNLIKKIEPSQTTLYGWDGSNRLVEVKRGATEATATTVATYQYDANGNRVGRTDANGGTTFYLVDANRLFAQVVEETAIQGATKESTVYLHGTGLIRQARGGQAAYYLGDGVGSTRILTDAGGNVTDSYDYEDFGVPRTQTGATRNVYLFAGEQFDADAKLYYNRARYLDPAAGRFVSLDPANGKGTNPNSLNKYAYANGDPIGNVDPGGEESLMGLSAAMDVASSMAAEALQSYLWEAVMGQIGNAQIGNLSSPSAMQGIPGSPGGAALVTALAMMCVASSKKCFLRKVPTLSTGANLPGHSIHIGMAITGNGNTRSMSANAMPFVLARTPRHDVKNRKKQWPCRYTGGNSGLDCDEYPYATTLQGGQKNWDADLVSLMGLRSRESSQQGNMLKRFYKRAQVELFPRPRSVFLNIAIPMLPTFFIDRKGVWRAL